MSGEAGVRLRPEVSEAEEIRAILGAVSDFLKELTPTIKELIGAVFGSLEGGALGREAGEFYKNLVEAGIDSAKATELTEIFIRKKMELFDIAKMLSEVIPKLERRVEEE